MENKNSLSIKAIDKETVHKICSGQVVLNLAVAVKELVENSLDAGASVVDIKLREYGSELIEVTDNGCGVEPSNFQGLTLKHHTSKLQDFHDLVSVETFGFRGEALSSLCSLSNLTVTTRHISIACGTRLVFDHNGLIISSNQVARQAGTTVILENIFSTLPVRQKEFHRNLKREFSKMTQLLYAYCLVSTGVRISCTNQTKTSGRMTVACTQGCKTVRENIASVFGTKQLASLLELRTVAPSSEFLEQLTLKGSSAEEALAMFDLEGMVSSCAHGSGRSSSDRQFYYVNSRPCEPSKIMKAVNEVYHQYNMHQHPFVFLDIKSARDSVDVNVTPDKRQVFIEHEKLLVATVKASLQALYEHIPSTLPVNNVQLSTPRPANCTVSPARTSPAALLSQWRHASVKRPSSDTTSGVEAKQAKLQHLFGKNVQQSKNKIINTIVQFSNDQKQDVKNTEADENLKEHTEENNNGVQENITVFKCDKYMQEIKYDVGSEDSNDHPESFLGKNANGTLIVRNSLDSNGVFNISDNEPICGNSDSDSRTRVKATENCQSSSNCLNAYNNVTIDPDKCTTSDSETNTSQHSVIISSQCSTMSEGTLLSSSNSLGRSDCESGTPSDLFKQSTSGLIDRFESVKVEDYCKEINVVYDAARDTDIQERNTVNIVVTVADLREYMRKNQERKSKKEQSRVRFRALIDPSKNQQAEQELSREISKDMFSQMKAIGQFNLGFIIAKLNSDLFIVDQHATDEKYNFETLQKTTSLSNQKLVVPQQLELTAINEMILIDNINIFKANGFEFVIDENAPPTNKIKLTSIPISRNWTFGKEDIDELLFMLQDAPNTLCRPSRVRAMFASRACRKSVMIGTALSHVDMQRLLTHMGEIEQPWNCPHGRPTMRHLVNLDFV